MAKKKQVFKRGDLVLFELEGEGVINDFLADLDPPQVSIDILKAVDGKVFKIRRLETYTELGDKDSEYYSISLRSDIIKVSIRGVSGYHLTPLTISPSEESETKPLKELCPNLFAIAHLLNERGLEEVLEYPNEFVEDALEEAKKHHIRIHKFNIDMPDLIAGLEGLKNPKGLSGLQSLLNLLP